MFIIARENPQPLALNDSHVQAKLKPTGLSMNIVFEIGPLSYLKI